jgi:hypothetical protein
MAKEIIFKISKKTGLIEAETFGYEGNTCEQELNFLKNISGDEPDVEFKDEEQPNYAVTDSG